MLPYLLACSARAAQRVGGCLPRLLACPADAFLHPPAWAVLLASRRPRRIPWPSLLPAFAAAEATWAVAPRRLVGQVGPPRWVGWFSRSVGSGLPE
eukprot:6154715-Alexandrium_andersonii.AAC.1